MSTQGADKMRQSLVAEAIGSRSQVQASKWRKLFEYDRQFLSRLSKEKQVEAQFALLLVDAENEKIPRKSHTMLSVCIAFVNYAVEVTNIDSTRILLNKMIQEKIGMFYKQTYETFATLELKHGSGERAKEVLSMALKYNVYKDEQEVDEVYHKLEKEIKIQRDGPAILKSYNNRGRSVSSGVDSEEDKMLRTNLSKAYITPAKQSLSLRETKTTSKSRKVVTTGRNKKLGGLSALGKAVRVKADEKPHAEKKNISETSRNVQNNLDTDERMPRIAEEHSSTNTKIPISSISSEKKKMKKKIGDLSYITNWNPLERPKAGKTSTSLETPTQISHKDMIIRKNTVIEAGHSSDKIYSNRTEEESPTSGNPLLGSKDAKESKESAENIKRNVLNVHRYSPGSSIRGSIGSNSEDNTQTQISNHSSVDSSLDRNSSPMRMIPSLQTLLRPKNIFTVNGRTFLRLALNGRGGSSKVFKVLALEDSKPEIYALKRIKLKATDENSIAAFKNEIRLMESLRGQPNIIEILDSEVNLEDKVIYVVMEYGEIDLNKRLNQQKRSESLESKNSKKSLGMAMVGDLTVNFIRLVWMDMLQAVNAVHEQRIVHGDLKPANFLFVQGVLKLIDFGIAKEIANDTVNIVRDTQVGTINFMSPEAIVGNDPSNSLGRGGNTLKLGRASDVWSLGCILYQMVYGSPPFQHLKIFDKLRAIPNPKCEIKYPNYPQVDFHVPPVFTNVMKACLQRDPSKRPTIPAIMQEWDSILNGSNVNNSLRVSPPMLETISEKENDSDSFNTVTGSIHSIKPTNFSRHRVH